MAFIKPMYCIEDLNELQISIVMVIKDWVKHNPDNPIPKSEILKQMQGQKIQEYRTLYAIQQLLKLSYIRHGYSNNTNKTVYVMMRSI